MARSMPSPSHIDNYYSLRTSSTFDMEISHRQVELFRAVMQAGSLSGAAQALHSSQPTLSRELSLMEQRLGYALFERSAGSRLKPTAAAQALADVVQRHYQGLAAVRAEARRLAQVDAEQLQLLALPALAHALLPAALGAWRERGARVAITPAESPLLEAWMAEQRFDLGLSERGQPVGGCRVESLGALPEVAVLPAGHALLAKPVLDAADFAGQDFVSLADEDPYRPAIDAWLAAVPRRLRLQTHSAVAACALVAEGLGLAIVNPLTALACASPRLHWRPLAQLLPFEPVLLHPLNRAANRHAAGLAAALRAATARLRGQLGA
jgi:DNA-binding transcriptional LysR family regulator